MWTGLLFRLRAIFRSRTLEDELSDELAFHLEKEAEKYRRTGASPAEARRLARLAIGGPEQARERCREARGIEFWNSTGRDLKYALRQLRGSPGFAIVAVLVLALGIGANTAIFTLLNAVMLRSLPVQKPQELFTFKWVARQSPGYHGYSSFESCYGDDRAATNLSGCSLSYPMYRDVRAKGNAFSHVAAMAGAAQMTLTGAGTARVVHVELVSGGFFDTLGVRAALGRLIREEDDTPNAPATAVLGYGYWQAAFGGDPSITGKSIRLNGFPVTIIGVTDARFNRLSPGRIYDIWVPLVPASRTGVGWVSLNSDSDWWLTVIARLRPGMTVAQAQQETSRVFANQLIKSSKIAKPESHPAIELIPADRGLTGIRSMLSEPLLLLMWAVGIILLITCANLAGLLMARAAARRREMAVRIAIGASAWRIFRQLLTESLLLSVAGGLCGVVFAYWGAHSLAQFLASGSGFQLDLHLEPDGRILGFTTFISVFSGILFGVLPALRGARVDPASPEHSTHRRLPQALSSAARRSPFAKGLVVLQIALSVLLLFGAGLLVQTLHNLRHVSAGFDTENLLLFGIDPTVGGYKDAQTRRFFFALRDRLAAIPGVNAVTYSSDPLLAGSLWGSDVHIEGQTGNKSFPINMLAVGPVFFDTMRIPVLGGRSFNRNELDGARPVAVVNRAFADKYLNGRNPIGLHYGENEESKTRHQIIGVVSNARYDSLRGDIKPTVYVPVEGKGGVHFEIRSSVDPVSLVAVVRRVVNSLDKDLPLFEVKTQREQIDQILFIERLVTRLASVFGVLALVLSCIGIYGLLSYEVSCRTRETGIRLAIGARPAKLIAGVLGETLTLTLLGIALGIPACLFAARAVSALLYGVSATNPRILSAAIFVLILVAALAGYLPARRASRVDPVVALRHD